MRESACNLLYIAIEVQVLLKAASAIMFEMFIILVGCAVILLSFMTLTIGFELTTFRDRRVLLEAACLRLVSVCS